MKALVTSAVAVFALGLFCNTGLADNGTVNKTNRVCIYHHHKIKCDSARYNRQRVKIGPYLSMSKRYSGSELLVNEPSVRESSTLLQYIYNLRQACQALGIPGPLYPNLTLSGYGELQYTNHHVKVTGAEIDALAQLNPWISAFTAIDYNPDPNAPHRVFVNRYALILGNLSVSPFYATVGQIYLPFGQFSTNMVTDPQTKTLGRIRAQTVMLGYHQPAGHHVHVEVFVFRGVDDNRNTNGSTGFGVDGGLNAKLGPISAKLGSSFVSNIGDSMGILGSISNPRLVAHDAVPGVDVYSHFSYHAFSVLAEYVSALDAFHRNVLAYAQKGAKPSAVDVEAAYSFHSFGKPSSIAIAYGHAHQVAALGLPKQRYSIVYNISVIRNTTLSFEFRHDIGLLNSKGKFGNANVFTTQINFYF